MNPLTLDMAEQMAEAAIKHARSKSLNPISISVIDHSGNLKFALREDNAGIVGVDIALGKARAALNFGCTSRQIADALAGNALAGPSVLAALQGRVVLLAGGVLIHDDSGIVIGAIAAAGDTPDNDESVVIAALEKS
jgi:uncharacterized protein GlcG (DUF336 family)